MNNITEVSRQIIYETSDTFSLIIDEHMLSVVYDVRFIAINDGVDSDNGISDFSGIKNYFNDFYARDTSKKIRPVQRAKGERGERVSTTIPYGYMKDPNDPKQYVPDKPVADVVKRIFEMYASGIGIKKICTKLEEEKIESPGVYLFRTRGSRSILRNGGEER